jgi:hypothetical protein
MVGKGKVFFGYEAQKEAICLMHSRLQLSFLEERDFECFDHVDTVKPQFICTPLYTYF